MLKQNIALKYSFLTLDELIINLDRISRFKLPEDSFMRVFSDIITKHLITPKYNKNEILDLDTKYIIKIVTEIWNKSVEKLFPQYNNSNSSNKALKLCITDIFNNIDNKTKEFINSKLKFSAILNNINYDKAPNNLKFLIKVNEEIKNEEVTLTKLKELREKHSLLFPIEKLLIVEGITEEILLPVFANKLNINFNNKGIYIIGAGGKSKSPSLYLKIKERINIPIILLFDFDAYEICQNLDEILKKKDKILIIQNGEFEDILSLNLVKRTLNKEYQPASQLSIGELNEHKKMCENIKNFYLSRHVGEFKKSKFAKLIAENIKYDTDISIEIRTLINNIVQSEIIMVS